MNGKKERTSLCMKCHYNTWSQEQEMLEGNHFEHSAKLWLCHNLQLKEGKSHNLQLFEKQKFPLDQIVWMWYQKGHLLSWPYLLPRHCGEVSHLQSQFQTGNWNQNRREKVQLTMHHLIRSSITIKSKADEPHVSIALFKRNEDPKNRTSVNRGGIWKFHDF